MLVTSMNGEIALANLLERALITQAWIAPGQGKTMSLARAQDIYSFAARNVEERFDHLTPSERSIRALADLEGVLQGNDYSFDPSSVSEMFALLTHAGFSDDELVHASEEVESYVQHKRDPDLEEPEKATHRRTLAMMISTRRAALNSPEQNS